MSKRVYRKTANAMVAHLCLIPKEHRPTTVYARYRINHTAPSRLYHESIEQATFTKLADAESNPDFVSFFIYE